MSQNCVLSAKANIVKKRGIQKSIQYTFKEMTTMNHPTAEQTTFCSVIINFNSLTCIHSNLVCYDISMFC